MFIWLGTSTKTRKVRGGRSEKAYCPDCDEPTRFVEVEVTESITLYSVIDLFDDAERAFRCTECGAIGQIAEDGEVPAAALEDLSPEAAERLAKAREAERAARARAERERAERQRIEREVRADAELAALKAKMGMVPEPESEPEPEPEPARRSWWKLWSR